MAAPGWYPDPADPSRQRYFDGNAWTENYAPFGAATPLPAQPAKTGMSTGLKIGLGVGAAFLALFVIGFIGDSNKKSSTSSTTVTTTKSGAGAVAPTPTRTVGVAPTATEPPKPNFTRAQENAIKEAESYLDYSPFSRQGLIDQLEYSDYSTADATFAVQHIEASGGVDWNEQAVEEARDYLDYTSFSLQGLVEQLEYSGFTPSQAQHGASVAYAE